MLFARAFDHLMIYSVIKIFDTIFPAKATRTDTRTDEGLNQLLFLYFKILSLYFVVSQMVLQVSGGKFWCDSFFFTATLK